MNPIRARIAAAAALAAGAAGDVLLRGPGWYLGLVGLVFLVLGAAWGVNAGREGHSSRSLLLALTALAATGLILRDAATLYFYDFIAILAGAALVAWLPLGRSLTRFRLRDGLRAWWTAFLAGLGGAFATFFRDPEWARTSAAGERRFRAVAVGTVLAVPPLFAVSALLGQADPAFGSFLTAWPDLHLANAAGHLAIVGAIAWPTAGWLRGTMVPTLSPVAVRVAAPSRLDFLGLAPALYGLAAVIAAYLVFQARALFGGATYVESTVGLTYAEYARRGFFELLMVTVLVLVVLLLADHLLDRRSVGAERRFRVTGWTLIALLGVLMLSALQRMWVYVSFFGLSDTRLYATAGMAWVGVALAWFGMTILRGRRSQFGVGLLIASASWIGALNVVDPEAVVVRVNLARALGGAEFDIPYHATLSADAVPALLGAAERLDPARCAALLEALRPRWTGATAESTDWRAWNRPRARARHLLAPPLATLQAAHCRSLASPTS